MYKDYSIVTFKLKDETDITDKLTAKSYVRFRINNSIYGSNQEVQSSTKDLTIISLDFKSAPMNFKENQVIYVQPETLGHMLKLRILSVVSSDRKNSVLLNINKRFG
ncbi:MAG: hypothetical protein ABF695_12355 [Liquorilactobacillus ghanensis]|uniref:hypothetical protein n=1 Tax=Liquorilactobacillus ghanensis TaxID=399370 RepID=UPI0039EA6834